MTRDPNGVLTVIAILALLSWMVPSSWKFRDLIREILFLAALCYVVLVLSLRW
jgi:hypothetical protein